MQGLQTVMRIVISPGFCGIMSGSPAIFFGNMVGKVNEDMCVC